MEVNVLVGIFISCNMIAGSYTLVGWHRDSVVLRVSKKSLIESNFNRMILRMPKYQPHLGTRTALGY